MMPFVFGFSNSSLSINLERSDFYFFVVVICLYKLRQAYFHVGNLVLSALRPFVM